MASFEMSDLTTKNKLSEVLDKSLDMLREADIPQKMPFAIDMLNPSLLDQCLKFCQQQAYEPESIRTLHHFGLPIDSSLLPSLATLPNTCVTTDIFQNLYDYKDSDKGQTLVSKVVHSSEQKYNILEDDESCLNLFLNDLQQMQHQKNHIGQRLLICDNYCRSQININMRSNFLTLLDSKCNLQSIIIITDPVESYRIYYGFAKNNEVVLCFEDYCQNVLEFVQTHSRLTVIRHEDFISDSERILKKICKVLGLPFNEDFIMLSEVFDIKDQNSIKECTQNQIPLQKELIGNTFYTALCNKFGYNVNPSVMSVPDKPFDLNESIATKYLFKHHSLREFELMACNDSLETICFARTILQWVFNKWNNLVQIQYEDIYQHADRDRFALILVDAHLQLLHFDKASEYTRLAIKWGCPRDVVTQILLTSLKFN